MKDVETPFEIADPAVRALCSYPLMDAIRYRRSRRFPLGATMPGGGLAHRSKETPLALSEREEAWLVYAAGGLNGFCLADLPMQAGEQPGTGGGNVMAALTGRTIASADAVHSTALFVVNDEATWYVKRPQDYALSEIDDLARMAAGGDMVGLWRNGRVKLRDGRASIAREVPTIFPFNNWSTNLPGTTYFLPVSDLSAMYINVVLSMFDEEMAFFVVDERNSFRPAGIERFARSRGGRLHDDPEGGRVIPMLGLETVIVEFLLAEQAFMAHNLSLTEQAMGLGGWTHFASASDTAWMRALGFDLGTQKVSQALRAGPLKRTLMRWLGQDRDIPVAQGLAVDGHDVMRPYCPPHYATMEDAVRAFLAHKKAAFAEARPDAGARGTWRDADLVRGTIPWFSDAAIEATIAHCAYVHRTYGRFPAYFGPMRTTLAHQAHHLELAFYDRHYGPGAYTDTQRTHADLWHA